MIHSPAPAGLSLFPAAQFLMPHIASKTVARAICRCLFITPSPVTQTETAPPGLFPGIQSPFFFICLAATYFFAVIHAIVRTSFVSTHNTTKAAGSPAKAGKLAIKYQSYCRLYQNPVTMIHLVLNDLRRPAGVGFQPCLHIHGLILHLDSFISRPSEGHNPPSR